MIRIGIPSFGTDSGRSGIGSYLRELILRFDRLQDADEPEFHFELIGPEVDRSHYLQHTRHIGWHQVEGADPSPIRNFFWNQSELPRICRRQKYDLLFLPAANRRLTGRAPCPTVGTVHDLASLHIADKYNFSHRVFNQKMLPYLIKRLDHIITVSGFSRDDIVKFSGVPGSRVSVIHLAADSAVFTPAEDRQAAAARMGEKYGFKPPYILYISRLEHPGKNHNTLIKAFGALRKAETIPSMRLVLPGPDKERAEEIHREAETSPAAADIVFPGFIDAEDLADFYRGAELFVLPSYFEGFGLPVLEAMACGTPVITSTAASLPEVSGPHTPHFDPDNVQALQEAIAGILANEERRSELSQAGLAWAADFSWEKTTEKTLEVFRSVLRNNAAPANTP
jgi:glycosyltransferase involved in cell wall biosynthesis